MHHKSGTFSFPNQVYFGLGTVERLAEATLEHGNRVLLVTDAQVAALPFFRTLVDRLTESGVEVALFDGVVGNPSTAQINEGAEQFLDTGSELVIGVGGGSAMDAAKAIALKASHSGEVTDYDDKLEGWRRIGSEVPPIIAVPTTSGTGSEVGRSTVITSPETGLKTVIFSPYLLPVTAIIDPELTAGLPPHLTAATGMDALSHNIEAYVAKGYHPICDGIALEGIRLIAGSLERAVADGTDIDARTDMAMASAMGAIAFQKGLGATHSLAHPLSTVAGLNHGLANALFLHRVMAFNCSAVIEKYARIGEVFGAEGSVSSKSSAAVDFVSGLASRIGIPERMTDAGVERGQIEQMVEQAVEDACHQSNPVPMSAACFRALYEAAC